MRDAARNAKVEVAWGSRGERCVARLHESVAKAAGGGTSGGRASRMSERVTAVLARYADELLELARMATDDKSAILAPPTVGLLQAGGHATASTL